MINSTAHSSGLCEKQNEFAKLANEIFIYIHLDEPAEAVLNAITRPNARHELLMLLIKLAPSDRVEGVCVCVSGSPSGCVCGHGLTFNSLDHNNDVTTFAMAKQKLNTINCKQKPK